MDVKLTINGVCKLLGKYFEQFEVHPLDVDKTTIASYGSYLFQNNLMKLKKIGVFSPNCLPMYTSIKNSSTGGLTVALRHSADSTDVNECPINSHLSPDFDNLIEIIAAYDVTSLYPRAAREPLPYGPGYMSTNLNQDTNDTWTNLSCVRIMLTLDVVNFSDMDDSIAAGVVKKYVAVQTKSDLWYDGALYGNKPAQRRQ